MSAYMDQINARLGNGEVDTVFSEEDRGRLPNVCQAFAGKKDEDGRWKVGPATVMVFYETGHLKFCVSPKFYHSVCFGTLSGLWDVLAQVELALESGACEWKPRGGKK